MLTVLGSSLKKVLQEQETLIPKYLGRYLVTKALKAGNKPSFKLWLLSCSSAAFADHLTAMQRRKAAVFKYVCSLWKEQEKERDGFANTVFFLLSAPSVLTTTFQYLQSQGELIHIITVMYLTL